MRFSKVLMAAAALTMTATPAFAAAPNPAAKLSLSGVSGIPGAVRAGAKRGKSKVVAGVIVAVVVVVTVAAGAVAGSSGSSTPGST